MTAKEALDARRNAEQFLLDMGDDPGDWAPVVPLAQAWALIAIAHELAAIRQVLEARGPYTTYQQARQ